MVVHKTLDYGFNGYQVPSFPRASRSARGRSSFKRKADNKQMCASAIELLAAVAENLLQEEGESSQSPSDVAFGSVLPSVGKGFVREEPQKDEKLLGPFHQSVLVTDFTFQELTKNKNFKEPQHAKCDMSLEHCSGVPNVICSENSAHDEGGSGPKQIKLVNPVRKYEGQALFDGELCRFVPAEVKGESEHVSEKVIGNVRNCSVPNKCSSGYPMELDVKPPKKFSSGIEVPRTSVLPFETNGKLVRNDDDEKYSGCTHRSTRKAFRPPPRIGDRRIRRLLASRYWKVPSKSNHREYFETDMRHVFRNKKACYTRQKSQMSSVFRRKNPFEHRLISKSEATKGQELCKSSNKSIYTDAACSVSPSLVAAQESPFRSSDSRVKLCIKSFRVPELFIEIPETATVGSLKRTVGEAVTAILSGGLCVGVVLQGKKVKDDNKTLLQTGISHDDKLDALGFMLEPSHCASASPPAPILVAQPLCQENSTSLVSCPQPQPQPQCPTIPFGVPLPSDASVKPTPASDAVPRIKAEIDSGVTGANPSTSSMRPLSVTVPPPPCRKSRQTELNSQRRIRRPFSVPEVEALVQAVEKLGTGRWRDVKVDSFDDAKHRTYVDLKDKWKTLVHTARIAPQQRRGEALPQELLDRVLAAHAYWSQQHQVKQQCIHLLESH
ncbi:hypothetical protein ACHQM5_010344 [Ranunculus cassubicifolius]